MLLDYCLGDLRRAILGFGWRGACVRLRAIGPLSLTGRRFVCAGYSVGAAKSIAPRHISIGAVSIMTIDRCLRHSHMLSSSL